MHSFHPSTNQQIIFRLRFVPKAQARENLDFSAPIIILIRCLVDDQPVKIARDRYPDLWPDYILMDMRPIAFSLSPDNDAFQVDEDLASDDDGMF